MIEKVQQLADNYDYEKEHAQQVTRLALKIFNETRSLHNFGDIERWWLQAASFLHDIGWKSGRKGHHKASRDAILHSMDLPFNEKEKMIVALIARYHRRAFPQEKHRYYASLDPQSKHIVAVLSSFLRIADGLDRTRSNDVKDIKCDIAPTKVTMKIITEHLPEVDKQAGKKKGDLFEHLFGRELEICAQDSSKEEYSLN